MVMKVQSNPPRVVRDPPREIVIIGGYEQSSAEIVYNLAQLWTDAQGQLGTLVERKLEVLSVKAYNLPGSDLSGNLRMTEQMRFISTEDAGGPNTPAAVGIKFPPNMRPFADNESTTGLVKIIANNNGEIHTLCRVWSNYNGL
jgi:hypothetical protein